MGLLDKIIVARIRDGDGQAFEHLVNTYKKPIFNYCLRFVRDYHQAEDLTQEVFVKLFRSITTYDNHKGSLETWLFTIAHNTCINSFRKNHQEESLDQVLPIQSYKSAEDQFLEENLLHTLDDILNTLSFEDRSIVLMKDFLGFKYHEISQITTYPIGTIKSRLHTIRLQIRQRLGELHD